jgi:hypothetical protein
LGTDCEKGFAHIKTSDKSSQRKCEFTACDENVEREDAVADAIGSCRERGAAGGVDGSTIRVVAPGIPTPKVVTSTIGVVLLSNAIAGQPMQFAAMPLEQEAAAAATYLWTFSDGQSAIGPEVRATFPVAGMYFAAIAKTNGLGEIAIAHIAFQVH